MCRALRLELIIIEFTSIRTLDVQKFIKAINFLVSLDGCIPNDMRLFAGGFGCYKQWSASEFNITLR